MRVRYELPPARRDHIEGYRVAVWSTAAECRSSEEVATSVELAGDVLQSLGMAVDREVRPDLDPAVGFATGARLIADEGSPALGDDEYQAYSAIGFAGSHRDWLAADVERAKLRARWAQFFGDIDASPAVNDDSVLCDARLRASERAISSRCCQ